MPRGVPKNGFRLTRKRMLSGWSGANFLDASSKVDNTDLTSEDIMRQRRGISAPVVETDRQIEERISERFEVLEELADAVINSEVRALIVSGPPGLGKSFTVEQKLAEWDPTEKKHTIVKGFIRATGLYKLLFQHKEKDKLLVIDDADNIFGDETSLNFLKAACDTTDVRKLSYLSEGNLVCEKTNVIIPKNFIFEGKIIFITNYDFDERIQAGSKLAPHLAAMISRSHYIDLAMKTTQDYIVRMRQVINTGMLRSQRGLNATEEAEVMEFITDNKDKLRELSLRIALKIATLRKKNPDSWQKVAKITCCRNMR